MHTRFMIVIAVVMVHEVDVSANDDPCTAPSEPFSGYWWGGQVQVQKHVAGIPFVVSSRFSYREIRHPPCSLGIPILPPGMGEAGISIGIPIFKHRRGGLLLRMGAQGMGSQRPGEPVSGMISGAPATSGHLNFWGTPIPLIQFTGAISSTILPSAREFPMSIAYLGGVRLYPLYQKHAQANFGVTVGGSNYGVNFIPAFGFRAGDFVFLGHRIAVGVEVRAPISLIDGSTPHQWRFWGALTLAIDDLEDATADRTHNNRKINSSVDLARTAPEAAPPTQTTWETPL